MSKPNRKQLVNRIKELELMLQERNKFILNECTTKGDVLRCYASMRCAIEEALGKDAVIEVLNHLKNMQIQDAYQYRGEAEAVLGKDYERQVVEEATGN